MTILEHFAEPYSPMGSMSAKGASRLLGRPDLDWLEILLREAIQNVWDARQTDSAPRCQISLRTLTKEQLTFLKGRVLAEFPEDGAGDALTKILQQRQLSVLELQDYNTAGLGGPSRADEEVQGQEGRNFIDFVRNFGSPRDVIHGGGTYGFGKSALHEASKCKLILVYSRAICRGKMTSRFIAIQLGDPYETKRGRFKRFTGRHMWGVVKEGLAEPLEGSEADAFAEALGLGARKQNESGTSIMILAPQFEASESRDNVDRIVEILHWNFWPKIIAQPANNKPSMIFKVFFESTEIPIGEPGEKYPQLGLFCDAMVLLKASKGTPIGSERPKMHLGQLASVAKQNFIGKATQSDRYPAKPHHIALMRPAELVVKYLACANPSDPDLSYGGVFICDSKDEVEAAFADSEPPAHDDWESRRMERGPGKTFVNVALRRIHGEMEHKYLTASSEDEASGGEGTSLAAIAESAAQLIGILPGDGASRNPAGGQGNGSLVRRPAIRFDRLEILDGQRCSVFSVQFPKAGKFSFKAGLQGFDGSAEYAPDGTRAEVLKIIAGTKQLDVLKPQSVSSGSELEVYVTVPDDTAVRLGVLEL